MKNRIVYVDCIKGLSIMIVVLIHVFESSICINSVSGEGGAWHSLTHAFIMPLFAFMSGLFIHGFYNLIDVRSKFERLMIPMLTLGVAYAYMKGHSFVEYAMHDFKYGYWYLLFLFESIIIISFVEYIFEPFKF